MISGNTFLTETPLLFVRLCMVLHSSIHADIYRYIILPFPSKNGIKGIRSTYSTYSTIKYFALFILCSICVQATNITHMQKNYLHMTQKYVQQTDI